MIAAPPREQEAISWLWVGIWILVIFLTIPVARDVGNLVSELWGRELFGYLTLSAITLAFWLSIRNLRQRGAASTSRYLWLGSTAAVYLGGTFYLRHAPEEAVHFVQYGVLGILTYRALTHRIRDWSIYLSAAIIGAIVGITDEAIQWITPRRFWGLRDIWIDFIGTALVQIGIAVGLRPLIIANRIQPTGLQWFCRLGAVLVLLIAATLLNTPQRITWYSERIPSLAFLRTNESVMFEYGYRYDDSETGPFKSRFSEAQLRREDVTRGKEAAEILNQFRDPSAYQQFLDTYTPVTDPFVHEARVHLFRRDRNLERLREAEGSQLQQRTYLTVAHRENRIMEEYFPNTLHHSDYVLDDPMIKEMQSNLLPEDQLPRKEVMSGVSKHLITVVREPHILVVLILVISLLIAVDLRLRSENPTRSSE